MAKGFGQTAAGFIRPSLADILEDTQEELDKGTGVTLRKDAGAVLGGQIAGVVSIARDEDWAQMEAIYHGRDPRSATGAALEVVCALDQVYKHAAEPSTGGVIYSGDVGAQALEGDSVSSEDDALKYALDGDTPLLVAATVHDTEEELDAGDVRSSAGGIYVAITAGTTGVSSPPTGTEKLPTTYTDGTVVWAYVGEGLGSAPGQVSSEDAGPIGGPAGALRKIGTPRAGLRGCLNPTDVVVGRSIENDEQLRVRREASVLGRGKSTLDGIGASLRRRSEVRDAKVFQNTEHEAVDGIPPHAVEPVVLGPEGDAVDEGWAGTIQSSKAAGIKAYGTTTKQVADSYGIEHDVGLTRPDEVELYALITVRANRKQWPSGGRAQAKAAVLGYGQAFEPGLDARHTAVEGAVWRAKIPGVLGVQAQLALVPVTVEAPADISINLRQIAVFDTARTDVVVVFEDP